METIPDSVAQEMAMHIALCVCADYVQSWGITEFLEKLEEYCDDPLIPALAVHANKLELEHE